MTMETLRMEMDAITDVRLRVIRILALHSWDSSRLVQRNAVTASTNLESSVMMVTMSMVMGAAVNALLNILAIARLRLAGSQYVIINKNVAMANSN